MSDRLRSEVAVVMKLIRSRTTPVARAWVQRRKAEGRSLIALIAEKPRSYTEKMPTSTNSAAVKRDLLTNAAGIGGSGWRARRFGVRSWRVTIGPFAGGVLAAFGVGFIW